jgi:NADH:ubiquinone oxidoreductase subunit 6 (subunit J)
MKIFSYVVIVLSLILIVFNFTKIDFDNPFEGKSTIALIGVICGFCAIFLMLIYRISKMVDEKTKDK